LSFVLSVYYFSFFSYKDTLQQTPGYFSEFRASFSGFAQQPGRQTVLFPQFHPFHPERHPPAEIFTPSDPRSNAF
ncbi:MAG: hypothetical protein ACI4PD_07735, partial [Butyricicoccus sp.]